MKAVERMASARGYRLSPRAAQEFAEQAQGLAQEDYYTWLGSQFQKADLALRHWSEGRNAAIQDWLMPWQMSTKEWEIARNAAVQDWTAQRTAGLEDWANQRQALLQDWTTQQAAESGNWMDRYNAWLNLLKGGQAAAGQMGSGAQALGSQLGNLAQSVGQMRADQAINTGNLWGNVITSGIENILTGWGTQPQPQTSGAQNPLAQNPSWQWAVNMP
jgi:hypothetical protein